MLIEEFTEELKEKDSPFVTVAKLYMPKQEVLADGYFLVMKICLSRLSALQQSNFLLATYGEQGCAPSKSPQNYATN